jgi:hypothetical protein
MACRAIRRRGKRWDGPFAYEIEDVLYRLVGLRGGGAHLLVGQRPDPDLVLAEEADAPGELGVGDHAAVAASA